MIIVLVQNRFVTKRKLSIYMIHTSIGLFVNDEMIILFSQLFKSIQQIEFTVSK